MTRGLLHRIVAATTAALVAAATCVLGASPAVATVCSSASGVSVVVDPGGLGGNIATACDPGSGEVASTRFDQSGFTLTYAQRQPGFVCRVNGAPASDPCVNTSPSDAYWALFWTDGTSGSWTYSSLGVTSLDVPAGGAVALAWQQGTRRTPGVPAPVHENPSSTAQPTAQPTRQPTRQPTKQPTATTKPAQTATHQPAATPTSTPTGTPTGTPSTTPSGPTSSSPGATSSAAPSPASRAGKVRRPAAGKTRTATRPPRSAPSARSKPSPSSLPGSSGTPPSSPAATEPGESGRVPTWLTLVALGLLLFALAATTLAARRRTRS